MSLKLAIVGYGNLGKSLEREIEKDADTELTAVYSRRNLDNPKYRPLSKLNAKNADFDVALIALGSYGDILQYADGFADLDTVDSFDTHAKIAEYKRRLNAEKNGRISVISVGWDPGLLSAARAIWGIAASNITTVWGEGISQGHSNAIRSIRGVIDAVQFTVPLENCEELIRGGITDGTKLHKRMCYVAAVESDRPNVEKEIKNMPNYFEGYKTEVEFVTPRQVRELKKKTAHCGQTITCGDGFTSKTQVRMDSNADYTAKIMLRYAKAIPMLKKDGYSGALDIFDIPLKYIADGKLI